MKKLKESPLMTVLTWENQVMAKKISVCEIHRLLKNHFM